jgi:hypothetical protein
LKKFFVLLGLPSNENNFSDHHNSYNKGPNLAFFSFTKSPSNSIPTIKFPKDYITSSYHNNMPKIAKAKIWSLRTLGVRQRNVHILLIFMLTKHWLHPCFSLFVQTKTTKIYKYFGLTYITYNC